VCAIVKNSLNVKGVTQLKLRGWIHVSNYWFLILFAQHSIVVFLLFTDHRTVHVSMNISV